MIDVLYIYSDPSGQYPLGTCITARNTGWPWSQVERGNEMLPPGGPTFSVAHLDLTPELDAAVRDPEMVQLYRVDNITDPTTVVLK